MKHSILAVLCFALMMFCIPLLALNGEIQPVNPNPPKTANVQAEAKPDASAAKQQPEPEADLNAESDPVQQPQPEEDEQETPPSASLVQVNDDGFRLLDAATNKTFEVSARDYVRGALASEMPPTFHPEALKAQAVAAHTYALNLKRQRREAEEKTDFTVDPENWKSYTTEKLFRERYGSLADSYWKSICEAADEVCSFAVTYEDEPIVAAYHSMSSGMTEDASNVWTGGKPYLVPVDSRGDTLAPDYETAQKFTVQEISAALQSAYPEIELGDDPAGWLEITERSEGNYVTKLMAGDIELTGPELRTILALRSANFAFAFDGGSFTFTVRGYGHGVGLSQYGADYMARQGASFDEILLHYYPGASLSVIKG